MLNLAPEFNQSGPMQVKVEKTESGKLVTIASNLPFSKPDARQLMRDFQNRVGCGATIKNGMIQLRGDWGEQFQEFAVLWLYGELG